MQQLKFLLLLFMATSCQFFETEKIPSETFYKEELKSIDWKEVDQYPSFANCENITAKPEQKSCFENTLSAHLRQTFSKHNAIAVHDLNDTVNLSFSINNKGKLLVESIKITATLQAEFPLLNQWLMEGIDTLHPVAPAYKRGIPVATKFTLPIVIKTEDL
jgi:predicted ester cyclase